MSTIESDDEAPESVSFGSSKQRAREDENALQNFRTQEKRNKKEKNRERDRKFKERAVQSGKSGKAKSEEEQPAGSDGDEEDAGPSRSDLEERMARAMKEADEESASGSESESDEGLLRSKKGVERDGSGDSSQDESEDVGSDSEASNLSEEEEEEDEHPKSSKYLPDHIFASAFSEPTLPKPTSKRKQLGEDGPRKAKKRRTKKSSKDVVVGSRTIRTLSSSHDPHTTVSLPAAELQQPKTVRKFLKRTLNLSGNVGVAKKRGWERRPAHLGVMKRSGPAANFVRGS